MRLTKLHIENFKGFKDFSCNFCSYSIIVGANNAGKTTIFQAVQLFFFCLKKTLHKDRSGEHFCSATQVNQIDAFVTNDLREIFYNKRTQIKEGKVRIVIQCTFFSDEEEISYSFKLFNIFGSNVKIEPETTYRFSEEKLKEVINLEPLFVPSFVGLSAREDFLRDVSIDRLSREGKHSEIIRNQVLRAFSNANSKELFSECFSMCFPGKNVSVNFEQSQDEWIDIKYSEGETAFDLIAAGSGQMQLINIISRIISNNAKFVFLDEPDAHMHDDLQLLSQSIFRKIANTLDIQFVISTHSPTVINTAETSEVYIIEKDCKEALVYSDKNRMVEKIHTSGIVVPPLEIIDCLRNRKALFVEGLKADYKRFIMLYIKKFYPEKYNQIRDISVIPYNGAANTWPFDAIDTFEEFLGSPISYVFLGDRDLFCKEYLEERISIGEKTENPKHVIHYLEYRNRECYFLNHRVLSRTLKKAYSRKNKASNVPEELESESILALLVDHARLFRDAVASSCLLANEPYIKNDRKGRTEQLQSRIRIEYQEKLDKNELPLKYSDGKEMLSFIRQYMATHFNINFSDDDYIEEQRVDEVPVDIIELLTNIVSL